LDIFGKKALRYNTLYRIEKGLRDGRASSLSQICIGLGISLKELREDTEEEKAGEVGLIRKRDIPKQYVYSEKAQAQIVSDLDYPFLGLRLVLEPQGETKLEQDPVELGNFHKWVYCLKGKVTVIIGASSYSISKDETLFFNSCIPHSFQNNTNKKASCIIIQNPKHI